MLIGMSTARIDSHAHVFVPALRTKPGARYRPEYSATVEEYKAVLATNGFTRGVLVQPSFLGTDNGFLLSALAAEPDRFRGVIVVDSRNVATQLSEARVAQLHGLGVRGVRLNLLGERIPDLAGPEWQAAGARMAELGWHLEIQAVGEQWDALEPVVGSWASPVVIDHLGLPRPDQPKAREIVAELASQPHVWVKVSAPYRSPGQEAEGVLARILEETGADRLIFGSDWPFTRHESNRFESLFSWAAQHLGETHIERVATDNPGRLFDWNRLPLPSMTP